MTKNSKHETCNIKNKTNDFASKLECGNAMVHPDFQGLGFLQKLLEKVKTYYKNKRTLLTAEIVFENYTSLFSFLKNDFVVDNVKVCSEDGAKLLYLFYSAEKSFQDVVLNSTKCPNNFFKGNTFEFYQDAVLTEKQTLCLNK